MSVAGLIPAAGFSSRMSGFKPLAKIGGLSALARQIGMFRAAGIERVLVAGGHRAAEVEAEAAAHGARCVVNPAPEEGMFSSVRCAVAALVAQDRECEAFFVLPVDVPLVRPATVAALLEAWAKQKDAVVLPTFQGRRGHPPLVPVSLAPRIAAWTGEGGLAGLFATQKVRELAVCDPHVLLGMNTDEELAGMRRLAARHDLPSREECLEMLARYDNVTDMGRAHSRAVARVALALALALNRVREKGDRLDPALVEAAGLLHDIAKGCPQHEREGARLLHGLGFARVARIVAAHRDLDLGPGDPLTEREIVYLADKLVQGERLVCVRERFAAKIERHGHEPGATEAITGRMHRALAVAERVEREAGASLAEVLGAPLAPG